jgi:L-rhamnose mutarotase
MERTCFVIELVDGQESEYEERHRVIWPEMVQAIAKAGIRNFTGFRRGREVIYYAECYPDRETAWAALDANPVNARWTALFDGIVAMRNDDTGRLFFLPEVAHLD